MFGISFGFTLPVVFGDFRFGRLLVLKHSETACRVCAFTVADSPVAGDVSLTQVECGLVGIVDSFFLNPFSNELDRVFVYRLLEDDCEL